VPIKRLEAGKALLKLFARFDWNERETDRRSDLQENFLGERLSGRAVIWITIVHSPVLFLDNIFFL